MRRLLAIVSLAMMVVISVAPTAFAAGVVLGNNDTCAQAAGAAGCQGNGGANPVNSVLTNAINLASLIGGITCVIFVIYGGVRYVLSSGDSGKMEEARNTIIYALIGALIIGVGRGIVSYFLGMLPNA